MSKKLTDTEKQEICDTLDNEGFDYGFKCYSDFKEYKDSEFHRLRKAFLKARQELAEYIGFE